MATLSDLVETIAKAEGLDPATVSLIARNVREAGLITTGGRGLSAAKMTSADAANLLIAVNATVAARHAPQTVRVYRSLESRVGKIFLGKLGDAIEKMIDAILAEKLPQQFLSCNMPILISQEFGNAQIKLNFHKPMPYAYLRISVREGKLNFAGESLCPKFPDYNDRLLEVVDSIFFEFFLIKGKRQRDPGKYGDREDVTSIGYSTIRAIAELLRRSEAQVR